MKLLALDGNSIINRAFYGIKLLTTKNGTYTNAIFGFLTMLQKLKEDIEPDAIAIAFDLPVPTFRHKMYQGYKANRKGMPNELAEQLPKLKQLLKYLGYTLVEYEGFEADDILGTLAKICEDTENECVIATGDRDSFQLISDKVSVRLMSTKFGKAQATLYDLDKIKQSYGVLPYELIQVKALQGDSSDNIPGVKGIGEKGALELVKSYHSLDNIYKNIDDLEVRPNIKSKLKADKENAYMSLKLGTINRQVPIDDNLNNYLLKEVDYKNASKMMVELEFFSLIEKIGLKPEKQNDNFEDDANQNKLSIENIDVFSLKLKDKLLKSKEVYLLADFTKDKNIKAIALNLEEEIYTTYNDEIIIEILKYLSENRIKIITHNSKQLFYLLYHYGIYNIKVEFDTMLAAYLLNPDVKDYSVEKLMNEYKISLFSNKSIDGKYKDMINKIAFLPRIACVLLKNIKQNDQFNLLNDIEQPLSKVLSEMEYLGFKVDRDGIKEFDESISEKLKIIENNIYDNVGYEFNINSPKQLSVALFEDLGLKGGKKTKTGYSTNAEVLEKLKYDHPVVELILEYRTLSKLKSTYCEGLVKQIAVDGRIHSNFKQTETRTGRISSTEPNLQNIPVRTELGRKLRKFFIAKDGCMLVDADYSQIELRVLAHIANDKNMIEAFKNNEDIHTITASQVFNMPIDMVTPIMRSRAKAVNFGIVYGISAYSLSQDIGVTVKQAKAYINEYLNNYKGVASYMQDVVNKAKENGYVETIFKRRRYLPELMSSNFNLRAFGERVAMNMPIQGTAADIIKLAMINVSNRLNREGLKAKLILQVHDELIVEAPYDEVEKAKQILTEEMQSCIELKVPLTVGVMSGRSWFDAKG